MSPNFCAPLVPEWRSYFTWIPFIKWILQLQHHSNISIDKNGKYIFTNDHNSIKALPTLEDLLACHARSKACLSCRRLSSRWRAACRRCAAALAPGPSWLSLSSRQSELARTIVTLIVESKFARSHFQPERIIPEVELKLKKSSDWVEVLYEHEDIVPILCSICTSRCSRYEWYKVWLEEWWKNNNSGDRIPWHQTRPGIYKILFWRISILIKKTPQMW